MQVESFTSIYLLNLEGKIVFFSKWSGNKSGVA
ncbi:hypothetical protein EDC23_2280 [Thiohalophilus thiocyanatoxydans]|uniref:Uncharacterized protein n=1 Tax=Thiohalophilus thiocyanatoxydans TaxID=381308 RepID=A0A4R8IRI2_9GAMM|nr:hypothetical protein EDC23_2280 [Thiohalophilus thiocyanatoxydans]